jgi:hypothetical protein
MEPGMGYPVPIAPKSGTVIRPYNTYPESTIPVKDRYIADPTDRAFVALIRGEIHTFPIGPEHPKYNIPAPTKCNTTYQKYK